jgi:hypothetical protein
MGQWLVGRSTHVTSRTSVRPPSHAGPSLTASWYSCDVYPVQIIVVGTSRRASLVSGTSSRNTPPGTGSARRRNVSICSADRPSKFSSASSSCWGGNGFSVPAKSGSRAPLPGAESTYTMAAIRSGMRSLAA